MINLFLQWNVEDPVSPFEDNRNTYHGNTTNASAQGNRNPFIDNPYLATVIWGGTAAENRWPNLASIGSFDEMSAITVYPNPVNDNKINIDSEKKLDAIQLINVSGQLILEIKKPTFENRIFSIDNVNQGFYFLKLSSDNQVIIKKVIVN